jgi:hypothetical protein
MDILNFISWIASKRRVVKTFNKTDLIPIGVRTETRDDKYTTVAITTEDFIDQLPPVTVVTDDVTIEGDGTIDFPIASKGPKSYVATIFQGTTFPPALTVISNTTGLSLTFTRTGPGVYESNVVNIPESLNSITFTCSSGEAGSSGVGTTIFTQVSSVGGPNKYFIINTFANTTNGTTILTTGNNDGLLTKAILEIKIYN